MLLIKHFLRFIKNTNKSIVGEEKKIIFWLTQYDYNKNKMEDTNVNNTEHNFPILTFGCLAHLLNFFLEKDL